MKLHHKRVLTLKRAHINIKHIVVIDPASSVAETSSFDLLCTLSPLKFTYHLPVLSGVDSLLKEDVLKTAAVIILGGYDPISKQSQWQQSLKVFIRSCMDEKVPILGLCWGHQWLANLFGGTVGKVAGIKDAFTGLRGITIKNSDLFQRQSGSIVVSHQDMVLKKPMNAKEIVFSEVISNEGFEYTDYPIWSFQGHLEANPQFCINNGVNGVQENDFEFGNRLLTIFLNKLIC